MMTDDALARIDRLIEDNQHQKAALRDLRAVVASERGSKPNREFATDDDFSDANLIELPLAAQRFGIAKDTLRKWCREYGCGVKRGGRWLVSASRVRARRQE